jgi:predicted adenine nucleotide alpha hydrolase (AANH) superfamily ATPase
MNVVVESEIIIRAVDKPFHERQIIGHFATADMAYQFIEKYLVDTKELHTYFSRQYLCPKEEYDDRIRDNRMVGLNVVLGQFEDMLYVRRIE